MARSRLLKSFRVRLLLLLAALLILTLSVQYLVNLQSVRANRQLIIAQQQAIMAGVALGVNSLSSAVYLEQMREQARQPLLGEQAERVKNVLIVDDEGNIKDSLDKAQFPLQDPDKSVRYVKVKDISLPPLRSAVELPTENAPLPEGMTISPRNSGIAPAAFYFPVETTSGRRYVIVVLGSSLMPLLQLKAQQSLLYTLAVLVVTTGLTALVVWRFTRPIKSLSVGARRVAGGDFSFRVPTSGRQDEMGELTEQFNEMTVKLGRTRELETKLHDAEKAAVVGRLASAIAHEIRNPLNYITLTLDHLRTSFAPTDAAKQEKFTALTTQLKSEVARINTHVTEFLNYSRPAALELQTVDLYAVARDALSLVEPQAAATNVETRVDRQGALPQIMADPESLRSALTNLIINGLQATDGTGGERLIVLSAQDQDRRLWIENTTTTHCLAPAKHSQSFEPDSSNKAT